MARKTPPGWEAKTFRKYILQCAIRDRESYLDAIYPHYNYEKEDINVDGYQLVRDTKAEIKAMKNRLRLLCR